MKLAVPSYWHPDSTKPEKSWDRLIAGGPAMVVINPASGPGDEADSSYKEVIRKCRKADILVLGYIATTWAKKNIKLVKEEKFTYKALYGIHHYFMDEAATGEDMILYYSRLKTPKSVLNPGTIPHERYRVLKMPMMNYETDMATYLAKPEPEPWVLKSNSRLWWHCVSNVPDMAAVRTVLEVAKARNAGFVWITDDVENNPYDRLPFFYEELAAACQ